MINITIYDNGFEIEGHAGYAPKGSDIICAAVSALSQTCRISIKYTAEYEGNRGYRRNKNKQYRKNKNYKKQFYGV